MNHSMFSLRGLLYFDIDTALNLRNAFLPQVIEMEASCQGRVSAHHHRW